MSAKIEKKIISESIPSNFFLKFTQRVSKSIFTKILELRGKLVFVGNKQVNNMRQFILAPNHTSHLDSWAVLAGLSPELVEKICIPGAYDRFYKNFGHRLITRLTAYHNFPFNREEKIRSGYNKMLVMLKAGFSLLIFGQGTRARDGSMLPFKPMLAGLAIKAKVPIIPVRIKGTYEMLPAGKIWPRAHPVKVIFGEPLLPEKFCDYNTDFRMNKVAKKINSELMAKINQLE